STVDQFSNPTFLGMSDLLLNAGVALAAWTAGWGGGLLALSVFPIALSFWPSVSVHEWVEAAIVVVVVALVRGTLERFRRSEKKLRALLASMTDVILVLDRIGTYVEVVPTNPRLLYRPLAEMLGRRIADVFPA